jgi:hypothetical protein
MIRSAILRPTRGIFSRSATVAELMSTASAEATACREFSLMRIGSAVREQAERILGAATDAIQISIACAWPTNLLMDAFGMQSFCAKC